MEPTTVGNRSRSSDTWVDRELEHNTEVVEIEDGGLSTQRLLVATAIATIGGFLFGYDTGVISGALPFIRDDLLRPISHNASKLARIQETIVSGAVLGAAGGSAVGGRVADRIGRRSSLALADVLFICGSVTMAVATGPATLIAGRVMVGLGIGVASTVVPVIVAELAPTHLRAKLVTANVLAITMGQFVSYLVNYGFAHIPGNWRWMLGVAAVPAALQLVGIPFVPEPRRRPHIEKSSTQGLWSQLSRTAVLKQLHIGLGLQVLQQLAGINTVMYFTPTILQVAGIHDKQTVLLLSLGPAAINALGTVAGMVCIERFGRRRLLLWSTCLVAAVLALLSVLFGKAEASSPPVMPGSMSTCPAIDCSACVRTGCVYCADPDSSGGTCRAPDLRSPDADTCPRGTDAFTQGCTSPYTPAILVALMLYLAAFAPGLGPVPWAVNAELYPAAVRGMAMGSACVVNWTANALATQTFLTLLRGLGGRGTWALYAAIAGLGALWAAKVVPETKGKSLDEIQMMFEDAAAYSSVRSDGGDDDG